MTKRKRDKNRREERRGEGEGGGIAERWDGRKIIRMTWTGSDLSRRVYSPFHHVPDDDRHLVRRPSCSCCSASLCGCQMFAQKDSLTNSGSIVTVHSTVPSIIRLHSKSVYFYTARA